ncbi:MAG TPA: AAA family ATPase [Patescibacteria group bacterium]|nr:AAA family ATPase [Patescibacteria group bacterium]
MRQIVIILVGPIAAGKGTVVEILKKQGFAPYSFSDRIKEEITRRGLEITRFTLNEVSNDLRHNVAIDVLAQRNADVIDRDQNEKVVVDGARNLDEVNFLKNKYNAKVIGIVADQPTRYERLKARGAVNENLTFEQFRELDNRELQQADAYAQQVQKCLDAADIIIDNNGSMEELDKQISKFINPLL